MSLRFEFQPTEINDLCIVQKVPITDIRGSFTRMFCARDFAELGLTKPIVQINHSVNYGKGMVRGMHCQIPPSAETKIVSCLRGKIFDVAIDLRAGSKTFLKWHGEELSEENQKAVFIPEGFAHGFQILEDHCTLLYLHTNFYTPGAELSFNVMDPKFDISWPLPISKISERDEAHAFMAKDFSGIKL